MEKIFFKSDDLKKIQRMSGQVVSIISTTCPDYPHNGKEYTFRGKLGTGISPTTMAHMRYVPELISFLKKTRDCQPNWQILLADLPELTPYTNWERLVDNGQEDYLDRCAKSVAEIKKLGFKAQTFSEFYSEARIDYLAMQEKVKSKILEESKTKEFSAKFNSFMGSRMELAEKFRGQSLSIEELKEASAHGMSLYVTHGTLLRKIFLRKNLIVVNHKTPNLQNFYLCRFVPGCENLIDTPKFPLGVLPE